VQATLVVAFLLSELVGLLNLAKAMFVARNAEGVEGGFFSSTSAPLASVMTLDEPR